jgi:hypothetical protein
MITSALEARGPEEHDLVQSKAALIR